MKSLIVDDDLVFVQRLTKDLNILMYDYQDRAEIVYYNDHFENIDYDLFYDLVFIDIDLQGHDGIDVAQRLYRIHPETAIVFITSHSDLVYKSFEAHPYYFFRKSNYDVEFRILSNMLATDLFNTKLLPIKSLDGNIVISLKDVAYIEAEDRLLKIVLRGNQIAYDTRPLKYLKKELRNRKFIQIHRSLIVNVDYIIDYNACAVILANNVSLPIGRTYQKTFKKDFERAIL